MQSFCILFVFYACYTFHKGLLKMRGILLIPMFVQINLFVSVKICTRKTGKEKKYERKNSNVDNVSTGLEKYRKIMSFG